MTDLLMCYRQVGSELRPARFPGALYFAFVSSLISAFNVYSRPSR